MTDDRPAITARDRKNARRRERRRTDPAYRETENAARRARMRRLLADPEYRKRKNTADRERMRRLMADPAYRARTNARKRARYWKAKRAADSG